MDLWQNSDKDERFNLIHKLLRDILSIPAELTGVNKQKVLNYINEVYKPGEDDVHRTGPGNVYSVSYAAWVMQRLTCFGCSGTNGAAFRDALVTLLDDGKVKLIEGVTLPGATASPSTVLTRTTSFWHAHTTLTFQRVRVKHSHHYKELTHILIFIGFLSPYNVADEMEWQTKMSSLFASAEELSTVEARERIAERCQGGVPRPYVCACRGCL